MILALPMDGGWSYIIHGGVVVVHVSKGKGKPNGKESDSNYGGPLHKSSARLRPKPSLRLRSGRLGMLKAKEANKRIMQMHQYTAKLFRSLEIE